MATTMLETEVERQRSLRGRGCLAGWKSRSGTVSAVPATDEELLWRFRVQDDMDAFETLVHRYEGELFNFLRRYLGSVEMAEDVFQTTFLQVHVKRDRFEEGRRFRPWLYAIATNQAIDAQRRSRRHRMASLDQKIGGAVSGAAFADFVAGHEPEGDARMEDEEARDWARSAVAELPEPMKTVLELIYHRGLKYREAADLLGIPLGTVKSRLHAAVQRLGDCWRSKCVDPVDSRTIAAMTA